MDLFLNQLKNRLLFVANISREREKKERQNQTNKQDREG